MHNYWWIISDRDDTDEAYPRTKLKTYAPAKSVKKQKETKIGDIFIWCIF